MFNKIISVVSVFSALFAEGQIVNGGFENHSAIPVNMGQWQVVDGWGNAGSSVASPDYYRYDGNMVTDIPETPMALVDAHHGDAVMGLILCGKNNTNKREYLSTVFSSPLVPGKKYMVGFKITNGIKTITSLAGLGVSDIGLHFSLNPVFQTGQDPLTVAPQLRIESVVYNEIWQSVNFIFIPDQPYTCLTMGVFGDDSDKTISIFEGVDPLFAYYFVDSFSIDLEDELYEGNNGKEPVKPIESRPTQVPGLMVEDPFFVPNSFTPNNDESNDVFKPVSNTLKDWEFEIFSKWGDRVFFTADEMMGWDGTFNGINCANGSYVWQVSYISYHDDRKPEKVEVRGIVNLLR